MPRLRPIPSSPPPFALAGFGWQATRKRNSGEGVSPEALREGGRLVAMWYVYFLKLSDNDIYVGSTNDLRRRVQSHQNAQVTSTKAYLPAELISYVAVQSEETARKLEQYFKSGSGKAFANKRLW